MSAIAPTPEPPYYAVIFSSFLQNADPGYEIMSRHMSELAALQDGYLGQESVRDGLGITISYWRDEESILRWKEHTEHRLARKLGRSDWYRLFKVRICRVERDYGFGEEH